VDQEHFDEEQQPTPPPGAVPPPPSPPAAGAGRPGGAPEQPDAEDDHYQRYNPDSVARYYEQYYQYPYYGGGQRRGWPTWATVLIVVLVVVIGGCGALAYFAYRGVQNMGIFPNIPPAKVHTGTALSWRELDSWPGGGGTMGAMTGTSNALSSADFDGDGDQDLLAAVSTGTYGYGSQQWCVYSVASGQQLMGIANNQLAMVAAPWDYQADGTVELAVDQYSETQILDTRGQLVIKLPGTWQSQHPLLGDLDGDGQEELLLYDAANNAVNAYDAQGAVVWGTPLASYTTTFVGDVDGDGQDEVITESGLGLSATGMGQAPTPLSAWQPSSQHVGTISGFCCADLNGDGTDEVIAPDYGYLDPASGTMYTFGWPGSGGMSSFNLVWAAGTVPFDLDGDGMPEIAIAASRNAAGYGSGTGLYIFDLSGTLVYHEEFGTTVHGLATAAAGGRDYLCVLLDDRLIAYP